MCEWHLTSDGPPVVPDGQRNITVWAAQDHETYGWVYAAATYWGNRKWASSVRADRWAYIEPPRNATPVDVGTLTERYLLANGWTCDDVDRQPSGEFVWWGDVGENLITHPTPEAVDMQFARVILHLLDAAGHIPARVSDANA